MWTNIGKKDIEKHISEIPEWLDTLDEKKVEIAWEAIQGLIKEHVNAASSAAGNVLKLVEEVIHYYELLHGKKYEDSKVPELEPAGKPEVKEVKAVVKPEEKKEVKVEEKK